MALLEMSAIARRHKTVIQRLQVLQRTVARKQQRQDATLARIRRFRAELLETEVQVQQLAAIDEHGPWAGVLGGEAGQARREARIPRVPTAAQRSPLQPASHSHTRVRPFA